MKCEKTVSGKHLFMPLYLPNLFDGSREFRELEVWKEHGVDKPMKCVACGIIDDTQVNTKKNEDANKKDTGK
jgi:hypothetical protein